MTSIQRRTVLQSAAGLALAQIAAQAAAMPKPSTAPLDGGDFAFLAGEWKIRNKRLNDGKWDEFAGEATVHSLLGGIASIEELRIPERNFFGMGVRVYHLKDKKWADHWCSAGNGVVNDPMMGDFKGGVGTFLAEDTEAKMIYRGVWDRITPRSCRWHQSSSKDGGKNWEWDWYMDWTRA